jgi:hypothetical protein
VEPAGKTALWVAAIGAAATVIAALIAVIPPLVQGGESEPSPEVAPSEADGPPTTAPGSSDGNFVLFDDFSAPTLESTKWIDIEAAAPFVAIADGVLRVQVDPDQAEEVSANVEAIFPETADAVRFQMTVQRIDGTNDGGAHAYVIGPSGRFHEIWAGPNGDGAPAIGYAICETDTPCVGYDPFTQRSERVAQIGRPVTVVVRNTGDGWQIEVDGQPWTQAAVERSAIESLKFGLYSFGEGFSIDFDDVYVDYAD